MHNSMLRTHVNYFRKFAPPHWGFYPVSMDNMIKQWHSIERVWGLMMAAEAARKRKYRRVALFRSDVVYASDIFIHDGDAVVPNFGHYGFGGRRGLNDRMFYGLRHYAELWATGRFSHVAEHVSVFEVLHSETFMFDFMQGVPYELKPICFYRVRATRRVERGDCKKKVAAAGGQGTAREEGS